MTASQCQSKGIVTVDDLVAWVLLVALIAMTVFLTVATALRLG